MSAIAAAPSKKDKEYEARERRWRAESDLRTLTEAAKIKKDPARMREAKKLAQEQMKQLAEHTK